jgi:RHS repeat-associated protein
MKLGDGVRRELSPEAATYTYAGIGYANPHALTQLSSGYSTSTFVYDNDGNVAQKTTDGTTTTYIWDYANRLIALGSGGATTTYGYDYSGTRVYQIVAAASTTTYPFKFFSAASSTKSSNNFATSTEYVFNGDTLLATVDQAFKNGSATGTPATRYIHPDHLGSTNVVTDASGTVVQTLDYYPYGATRISQSTGGADSARKYIDQFADASGLNYLQARYQDPQRGQFISQDPVFWESPKDQDLENPQSLNSYAYANDNPITRKDPSGRFSLAEAVIAYAAIVIALTAYVLANSPVSHSSSYAPIYDNVHIVQPLPTSHPANSGTSYGTQTTFAPLVNTGASGGAQSGVSVTPMIPGSWPNINLFKGDRVNLPAPAELAGKTPQQVDQILKGKGLTPEPGQKGVTRYPVPGQTGDQVLIEPGSPANSDPIKQGPYGRVIQNGVRSDPFPLAGNPALNR